MIFSTLLTDFPTPDLYLECFSYKDQNEFEWKIARVKNGFFVAYFGDSYFKNKTFELSYDAITHFINNTGCFFIESMDFDVFYNVRNVLKSGYTDDIWEIIEEMIKDRVELSDIFMECEIIN